MLKSKRDSGHKLHKLEFLSFFVHCPHAKFLNRPSQFSSYIILVTFKCSWCWHWCYYFFRVFNLLISIGHHCHCNCHSLHFLLYLPFHPFTITSCFSNSFQSLFHRCSLSKVLKSITEYLTLDWLAFSLNTFKVSFLSISIICLLL